MTCPRGPRVRLPVRLVGLLLWLLPASASPGGGQAAIDDDVYTTHRQVDWDDFRGRGKTFRGAQQARIATLIEMKLVNAEVTRIDGGGYRARPTDVRVYALMHKLESAYRRGGRSDWALAHEQAHFDITELHARRLRRELRGLEVSAPSADAGRRRLLAVIEETYGRALQALEEEQLRYDGETGHGTRKKVQKRWWKQLAERLAAPGP